MLIRFILKNTLFKGANETKIYTPKQEILFLVKGLKVTSIYNFLLESFENRK